MDIKYAEFIKALRTKCNFSQAFVAEKLDISRPSYIAIEKGTRELTLDEAEKLKDLFGISLEEFIKVSLPKYEKYKQMIIAFLQQAQTKDGKIPKTKLAKLLYLADFSWYYDHLESMSGMQYLCRTYGPVPDSYFRALAELEEEGKILIDHKGEAFLVALANASLPHKLDLLSSEERTLIGKINTKWQNKNTREIVHFTHEQLPYKLCVPNEVIAYELITQQDPDYVY